MISSEIDMLDRKQTKFIYEINSMPLQNEKVVDLFLEFKKIKVAIFNRMVELENFADSIAESDYHDLFVREYLRLRIMHHMKPKYSQKQILDFYAKSKLPCYSNTNSFPNERFDNTQLNDKHTPALNSTFLNKEINKEPNNSLTQNPNNNINQKDPNKSLKSVNNNKSFNITDSKDQFNRSLLKYTKENYAYISKLYDLKTYLLANKVDISMFQKEKSIEDLMKELKSEFCYLSIYNSKVCICINYALVRVASAGAEFVLDIDYEEDVYPNFKLDKVQPLPAQIHAFIDQYYQDILNWQDSSINIEASVRYDMEQNEDYPGIYVKHNYFVCHLNSGWVNHELAQEYGLRSKKDNTEKDNSVFPNNQANDMSPNLNTLKFMEFPDLNAELLQKIDISKWLDEFKEIKYKFPIGSDGIFLKYRKKEFDKWSLDGHIRGNQLYKMLSFFLECPVNKQKQIDKIGIEIFAKLVYDIVLKIAIDKSITLMRMVTLYNVLNNIVDAYSIISYNNNDSINYHSLYLAYFEHESTVASASNPNKHPNKIQKHVSNVSKQTTETDLEDIQFEEVNTQNSKLAVHTNDNNYIEKDYKENLSHRYSNLGELRNSSAQHQNHIISDEQEFHDYKHQMQIKNRNANIDQDGNINAYNLDSQEQEDPNEDDWKNQIDINEYDNEQNDFNHDEGSIHNDRLRGQEYLESNQSQTEYDDYGDEKDDNRTPSRQVHNMHYLSENENGNEQEQEYLEGQEQYSFTDPKSTDHILANDNQAQLSDEQKQRYKEIHQMNFKENAKTNIFGNKIKLKSSNQTDNQFQNPKSQSDNNELYDKLHQESKLRKFNLSPYNKKQDSPSAMETDRSSHSNLGLANKAKLSKSTFDNFIARQEYFKQKVDTRIRNKQEEKMRQEEEELTRQKYSPRILSKSKHLKRDYNDLINFGKESEHQKESARVQALYAKEEQISQYTNRSKMSKGSTQIMSGGADKRSESERIRQLKEILKENV